jgi:hypothetical protein
LKGKPSSRKARLLLTAVARIGFTWCKNLWFNEAVAAAEEWADTDEPPLNLNDLRNRLRRRSVRSRSAESDWRQVGMEAISPNPRVTLAQFTPAVQSVFADAYREVFPNPFVMIEWKPEWATSTVRDLARTISEDHRFDVMPILADALQDAGCEHQMILGHCRGGGPHARGCWVLDGLLGWE